MNITIIVGGRFHAFNLAQELNKKKYLNQLITSYPKYYIHNNFKIQKEKIKSLYLKEFIQRSFLGYLFDFNDYLIELFDKRASTFLTLNDLDILIGWSSFSYHSFKKVKNEKCIKILERGSTHIEYQNKIIEEEYNIQNLKPRPISRYIIEKEKKEYELADYIMVPTDFAKKTFLEKGFSSDKIIKNPYGVSLEDFRHTNLKKDQSKIFRIIYTGSVSVRKGVLYLLEVFNEIDLEKIELMIIGNIDKELNTKLEKFRLNKKIVFMNAVKQKELEKFYNISDIFITCSIEEGLSMVQLQAMACGLPVICTINSGGEEIVDDGINGYIIPIRDKNKLREKILYLYNNRTICSEMGKKAEFKSRQQFSWDLYGKNAISIYQKLLKR
tara:strand:- start:1419 stop:2570 length:1152 start_codon:yes stop_codon:yes gene_type:complete